MSSVGCPRCEESFRVPDSPLPQGLRLRCPWCSELFDVSELSHRLPPMAELIGDDGEPVSLQSIVAGTDASLMSASSLLSTASKFDLPGGESLLRDAAIHRIEPGEIDGEGFDLADQEPFTEAFDSSKTIAVDQTVVIHPDEDSRVFDPDRFDEPAVDLAASDQNDEMENVDDDSVENVDEYEEEDGAEYEAAYDAEYDEDLEFGAEPDEVDSQVGAYDDAENEAQRIPIQGPVAPRPLSAAVARDFGSVPVAARPRPKKKGSSLKTALGILGGGLLAIPAAAGVLTLFGRKPDLGFYPFLGAETETVAGVPMQMPDRPFNPTKFDESSENGLPLDGFNALESALNLPADELPSPSDSTASEPMELPASDLPPDFAESPAPPTNAVTPDNTAAFDTAEPASINDNLPLLTNDASESFPPSITLEPITDDLPSKTVSDPVIETPGDFASRELPPSDLVKPLTMPAEELPPVFAESGTADADKANESGPSLADSLEALAMGKTDAMPAVEKIVEPEPEPAETFSPPASPPLVEAIEQAKTALREVTEFPKDGDAAKLKGNKALLYTSISNLANVPQTISQPETTRMLDEIVASGLMTEMTAVALNWLKYSKRTHDGLFAVGQAVQENGEWVLKMDSAKGPTAVQMQGFDSSGIASGERAVVLAKIVNSSPPEIIRVVYMKKQEAN